MGRPISNPTWGDIDALRDRLRNANVRTLDLEAQVERLEWLIANGEQAFGTLWRDATEADIDTYRHGASASAGGG